MAGAAAGAANAAAGQVPAGCFGCAQRQQRQCPAARRSSWLLAVGAATWLVALLRDVELWAVIGGLPPAARGGGAAAGARRLPLRPARGTAHAKSRVTAGAIADKFDPWSVLGISPTAQPEEARKAYKKLIAKYHPDVDPSKEGQAKFEQIVRAHAVVTGEDKNLDGATLLKNAVENIRNDIEFKRAQIEKLKAQAAAEEADMVRMEADLETAQITRDKVTQELGVFGGAALGLLVGGPPGLVLGAVLGVAVKDRDDALGQVIRGTGSVAKGILDAVRKVVDSKKD